MCLSRLEFRACVRYVSGIWHRDMTGAPGRGAPETGAAAVEIGAARMRAVVRNLPAVRATSAPTRGCGGS
ncbi:hypothetical protein GCM10027174_27780 [Salinifilum aidingensis]